MDISILETKYKENKAQKKVRELEKKLSSLKGNSEEISQLSKDLSYFSELSQKISQIQENIANFKDAEYMVENESDPEIRELAQEELSSLKKEISALDGEIRKMKISKKFDNKDDDRSSILEIRAGAGGDEASLLLPTYSECTKVTPLKRAGLLK